MQLVQRNATSLRRVQYQLDSTGNAITKPHQARPPPRQQRAGENCHLQQATE
ncbi:uncharacterized protein MYCFIDRAFT_181649 [Pseudocercospora fijiensis CIRAD86]|uniref:Uncharacterized protein n=1 Tax=Pseudocercospora fijiensis (strain CIRAD86) TaxID=383855 RepID=M3B7M4_PSEFD|nr:uncharacterized protein MYCFIDRAFT_181649 [Pseudocercospora fijiensis CIRAD86]EME85307.1 hypothetical protein MYCFIDRAFT_181649 [Pseudocercospora fijiensis CIRAD86]